MPPLCAIGIDLGTTYSCVAQRSEDGRTAIVPNQEGDVLTPSVVFFDDGEILVGKEARKAGALKTDRLAECVKRARHWYNRVLPQLDGLRANMLKERIQVADDE